MLYEARRVVLVMKSYKACHQRVLRRCQRQRMLSCRTNDSCCCSTFLWLHLLKRVLAAVLESNFDACDLNVLWAVLLPGLSSCVSHRWTWVHFTSPNPTQSMDGPNPSLVCLCTDHSAETRHARFIHWLIFLAGARCLGYLRRCSCTCALACLPVVVGICISAVWHYCWLWNAGHLQSSAV